MRTYHLAAAVAAVSVVLVPVSAKATSEETVLETVEVFGTSENSVPGALPALQDGKVFAGKKTTLVDLTEQPAFVEPNLR